MAGNTFPQFEENFWVGSLLQSTISIFEMRLVFGEVRKSQDVKMKCFGLMGPVVFRIFDLKFGILVSCNGRDQSIA